MISGLYLKLIAAGIIVAAVLGGVWYVKGLQNTVKELRIEIVLKNVAIEQQNAAVETLKTESDARVKAAEVAIATAKKETEKAKGKSVIIYKTKPSDPSDLCGSALRMINGQ